MNDTERKQEQNKYSECYRDPEYRMKGSRREDAFAAVTNAKPKSLLDIGCGRGDILDLAYSLGADDAIGIEVVDYLIAARDDVLPGVGWELPFEDNSFDVVTCFDVMEHLLPGDDLLTMMEMDRVAERVVIISASNKASVHNGVNLHINIRTYTEWYGAIGKHISGTIQTIHKHIHSPVWVVNK